MGPIEADFTKRYLFPPDLEDFVPADHPARFIREFVECILTQDDVKLNWREECGEGRPSYAPALLLRVWLYAYLNGITSMRRVELACRDNVGMLWLTGLHAPDHNTLWRFWKMNVKQIREVFRKTVQIAFEAGMISMALHAVDGTKIQARASTRKAWRRKDLEKFLTRVDQRIARMEAELESGAGSGDACQIPEALQEAQALRAVITEKLGLLRKQEREHYNPSDPDAESMKLASGGTRLAYNAQITAEGSNSIIVAEQTLSAPADQGLLNPMLDLVEEQLGGLADDTVADGGYNTEQTLVDAHNSERAITLAAGPSDPESNRDKPYHASRFAYDASSDTYMCPQGQTLTYKHRKNKGQGRVVLVYQSAACRGCPVLAQCARSRSGRTIERSQHHHLVEAHRNRRSSDEGRARLKRRGPTVERPFACIKGALGFVRFSFHGLESVAAQWTWVCTTHNLKILLARWTQEVRRQLPMLAPRVNLCHLAI